MYSSKIYSISGQQLSLVNPLGQEVLKDTRYLGNAGAHLLKMNVGDLQAGVYFMRVKAGNNTIARKFIVE